MQALIKFFKDEEAKRETRLNERLFAEELATTKQMSLMRLVLSFLVENGLNVFYQHSDQKRETDDVATRAKEMMMEISPTRAASLYCQLAADCNIPVHSSLELFEKATTCEAEKETILTKVLNPQNISPEEGCYKRKLGQIFEAFGSL